MMPQIDFATIRPFRGTQHGGFEELSVQLFRARFGEPFAVTRVEGSGGDGGVEAFFRDGKGKVQGVQAKYFRKLGASQWKQIQKSLTTARTTHTNLTSYIVAVPLNRTQANIAAWKKLAFAAKKRGVTLIWWGESELSDLLSHTEHHGRMQYWFGTPEFSETWIDEKNACAVADLDSRYTPQHHVEVESERILGAFARFDEFLKAHYQVVRKLLKEQRECEGTLLGQEGSSKLKALVRLWQRHWKANCDVFGNGTEVPNISKVLGFLDESVNQMRAIFSLAIELRATETAKADEPTYASSPFDYSVHKASAFLSQAMDASSFWQTYVSADVSRLLVLGDAGSGKSHLLAKLVKRARGKGTIALLGLGEYFRSTTPPWGQWLAHLGWSGTQQQFFAALNTAAEASGMPALLCIDALNESGDRSLWHTGLRAMGFQLNNYPWVRLVVSCRSDFARLTLPNAIRSGTEPTWGIIEHAGFGRQLFAAVTVYFKGYGIRSDHFPPLLAEFENPLFLKTLCEAFANDHFPAGPLSLKTVMDRRVKKVCDKLLHDIDCPEIATRDAIHMVAREIAKNGGSALIVGSIRAKIDALFPGRGDSESLYRHLLSNGILVEVGSCSSNDVLVRFPFERFSEYFIAEEMLTGMATLQMLTEAWTKNDMLTVLSGQQAQCSHRGLVWALTILLPERFSVEFITVLGHGAADCHYEVFLETLAWRSAASFNASSHNLLSQAEKLIGSDTLTALLRVSTIPKHPFNADFLHERLFPLALPAREISWTIPIGNTVVWESPSMPDQIIDWAMNVPIEHVPDEQVLLVATCLSWFFSSNHKGLRNRATVACLRLLQGRANIAARLVERFSLVNDPYVSERVYCVAAGVAMRESDFNALRELAAVVFREVFSKPEVFPHIFLRDYARCVLETTAQRRCLPAGIKPKQFRPPYRTTMPTIWDEPSAKACEDAKGWGRIKESVQPEGAGYYGDFGRYVMGAALYRFSSVSVRQTPPAHFRDHRFSDMEGRRWVLQRVAELGWTPERFGEYEKKLPTHGRQRNDIEASKAERISKKYQWIALRELQGYLSDHNYVSEDWGDRAERFEGNWQIGAREFDPSQPLRVVPRILDEMDYVDNRISSHWWEGLYPSPFGNARLVANRRAWVASREIPDFNQTLRVSGRAELPGDWLMLTGMFSWNEPLPHDVQVAGRGQLKMWTFVRSWLVKQSDLSRFVSEGKGVDFFGNGCDHPTIRDGWLGEYPWAASHDWVERASVGADGWLKTITVPVITTACEYSHEQVFGYMPSPQVLNLLGAEWDKEAFGFVRSKKQLTGIPRVATTDSRSPLFVDTEALSLKLKAKKLALVWTLVGERDCWDGNHYVTGNDGRFSAVHYWTGKKVKGGITFHLTEDLPR